ncbi:polymorphic toxin-type HINT domain-containing protein [Actinomyces israelii]
MPPCGVPVHISAVDVDAHPLRKLTARGQTVSPPPETFTGFFRRSKSRGPLYLVRGRCRGGPATDDIAATTDTKISFGSGRSWAGSPAYRPQVFVHHDVPTLRLTTTSGTITTTATHPVYAHGRGYVPADQLHTGDTLHTPDGTTVKVQAIQATGTTTVHNLHVPATNNYHVHTTTNQPILVHNDTGPKKKGLDPCDTPSAGDVKPSEEPTIFDSRNAAFRAAKRDARIPAGEQPSSVAMVGIKQDRCVAVRLGGARSRSRRCGW